MFVLFAFLGSGIWVAISLFGSALIILELFTNVPVGRVMATSTWGMMSTWSLTAMPLFILMGEILFRSRLSEDMFKGLAPLLSRLPGGLLHINIVGCALFAACSGSSAVTAATIGKMSLPELEALKYPKDKSIATLAGSGTLGFLILTLDSAHRVRGHSGTIDCPIVHRRNRARSDVGRIVHGIHNYLGAS